jgi:hypothetical protein
LPKTNTMARPGVNITLTNGGLNLQAPGAFGDSAVLVASPAAPVAGYGTAFLVKSKKQVETAFGQAGNEAVVAAIGAFYDEAPEGTKLHVLAMAQATNLATLLAAANADKPLVLAAGSVRLMAVIKFPAVGYTPTITNGFDVDVHNATTAAQTISTNWLAQKKPLRILIEGWGFTNAGAALNYADQSKANVGIVVGSVDNSTAWATMLALGRAARAEPQQNIGRVKTGSLNIADNKVVRIGATVVDQMPSVDLDSLHEKRYITFEKNAVAPGYVWNDDIMLTAVTDDYGSLRNGRVADNAVRIAYATYYRELKDDVNVDEDGRLTPVEEKALEAAVERNIELQMGGQLSSNEDGTAAVECIVNPDPEVFANIYEDAGVSSPNFNLLSSGTVYLFVRMRPKGCLTYINVFVGFSAEAV